MKKLLIVMLFLPAALVYANGGKEAKSTPVSPGNANRAAQAEMESALSEGDGLSLAEAIEQSAAEIVADLPAGSRVAIVAFDSEHGNLSSYIMDELGGALAESGLEVAERRNLPVIYQELNFQMSGEVSDESAVSVGKFLEARYVLTGQLIKAGDRYRYRLSGINVETAALEGSVRLDVRNSRALNSLIADLRNAKVSVSAAYKPPAALPGTAGAFLDRGILFATRGDFDLAIEDFTEAIRLDPNMAAAYLQRSKALHASVSTISDLDENFEFLIKGMNYSEKNKDVYNRALEDASAAIKLAPALASAYRNRGRIYDDMGEHDKAVNDFNQALKLDPNYAHAYYGRGRAYDHKKDSDRAIADYTQAIRLDPNYAFAYYNRGFAYQNKGDYDRAIADYTAALRIDPNYAIYTRNLASAYNNRGLAYDDKGDYDRAIADYTAALRLDPNYAFAYYCRGLAYYNKGDYDHAIADYAAALRIDPNNAMYTRDLASAYNDRGLAYQNKGDYDRAVADYTQAIKIDPNYAFAYNNRGNAYQEDKGDYDRAIGDYTQAIRLDPNYTFAYNNRGFAYQNKGDYDRAVADYTQAIKIDPNFALGYINRGNAYYNKKDYDRAIADYTAALRIDPNYANAYVGRGNAYWNKMDYTRARADYEKALQLDPNNAVARNNLELLGDRGR